MRISDWSSDVCSSDLYEESFRLPGTSAADLDAGFAHDGKEHLDAALALGNGALMAMPHLGGWEWAGFCLTQVEGVQVTVVVAQLEPTALFEWFAGLPRLFGFQVVPPCPPAAPAKHPPPPEN